MLATPKQVSHFFALEYLQEVVMRYNVNRKVPETHGFYELPTGGLLVSGTIPT